MRSPLTCRRLGYQNDGKATVAESSTVAYSGVDDENLGNAGERTGGELQQLLRAKLSQAWWRWARGNSGGRSKWPSVGQCSECRDIERLR